MGGGGLSGCMGQRGLHEMRVMRGGRGRVVWLYGSEGLLEMRGLKGVGGGGLSGMGQGDDMR